ncbi:MAG TPA: class I SAM-dependent methyltransferase [Oligoflexus sp.]|uniref:class I SAM-dependent methyltransferase n=1 Tax=Oligoflexus sp. TaxID=1971216 RepID=UPI002D3A7A79|nr:class I SAM-dependent methyltransferase [Oligoflexus sp.]HYX38573.1 class I SAM-dependent methyltransferase [Oligoflexus sp.]
MSFWLFLAGFMAVIWVLDGLRLRRRARSLAVLAPTDEEPSADMHFITRQGSILDDATRRAAASFANAHALNVLVLLPGNMPAAEAMLACQAINPEQFRKERIANAKCSGEAILVRSALLERFGQEYAPPASARDLARLADQLKKYAGTSMDLAVVPWLQASPRDWREQGPLVELVFGGLARPIMLLQVLLVVLGVFLIPGAGIAACLAYHLQPLLALGGTSVRAKGLLRFAIFRVFYDVRTLLTTGPHHPAGRQEEIEKSRVQYRELMAGGTAPFFEGARPDCPICGGTRLKTAVSSRDWIQFKPGVFTLSRCLECQHLFQNPRLSIAGLNFYYKDFYDGLGQERSDVVFSHGSAPYVARAKMLKGQAEPRRWLDVGAGHGHFCCVARDQWPGVSFDGLDLNQGVLDAAQRGWIDRAWRGLFPDLVDTLAKEGAYDVISMSHYLEHTRDPDSEIAAAAKILPQGGHLMIELPDPESRFGQWFGSFWMPWFQPQHQHMLSARNLERLLHKHSFETLTWHRGEAHQPVDFVFSMGLMLNALAPPTDMPWRKPATIFQRLWNKTVFLVCLPIIIVARILDKSMAPLFRRPGWSNSYRVLARRMA